MTHIVPAQHHLPALRLRQRNRTRRLMLLSVIALCGVTMIAIVVSQPKVTSQMQLMAQHVSARYNGEEKGPVTVLDFDPEGRGKTSNTSTARTTNEYWNNRWAREAMPRDRVRVRRSGILE